MSLALVVLAHRDPAHLHRLLDRLPLPTFLHCDAKVPPGLRARLLDGLPERVTVLPSRDTRLASWSLVLAELDGLRAAVDKSDARHIVVMSAADYPLAPVERIVDWAADYSGTLVFNVPIPLPAWSRRRSVDGGMWRFDRRYLVSRDQLITVKGIPVRLPWRRAVPQGLHLRASSHWKVCSRADAEAVLELLNRRGDLVDFWRTTLIPEESCLASLWASPELIPGAGLPVMDEHPWLMRWPPGRADHPLVLTEADWPMVAAAVRARPVQPGHASPVLFARKFDSRTSAVLLDRIDEELLR